jgi:cobalt/nickel transport protein
MPDMADVTKKGVWTVIFVGLVLSLIIAGFVSFYADENPDGLEKVAEDQGFMEDAQESANSEIIFADYGVAGVEDERLSVGLAGILGVVVMSIIGFGLFHLLAKGNKSKV